MIAFITYITKLLIKLIFVDEIVKENEELKKEVQQLKQEKEEFKQETEKIAELEERNQQLIQQNFNLVRKYIAVNQQKEALIQKLDQYKSAQSAQPFNHYRSAVGLNYSKYPTTKSNELDINQKFDPEDWDIIDQLLQEFNPSEELTI